MLIAREVTTYVVWGISMVQCIHSAYRRSWFQFQCSQVTLLSLWIALVSGLQAMLVEDFEYYAVYESSYSDLALSFLTFKPVEYLCEVVAVFAIVRGGALVNAGLRELKGRFNLAIAS
ncbi:MAG: hypothetical protein ACFB4J_17590 [Elainellaceae cyanobacterium]